jgi:CheY-like chemotaxis protein
MMSRYLIVLADDHVMVRRGIRKIIEDDPHLRVVGEAGDGLELTELLRTEEVDLAIVDITMPNISGIELTVRMKALYSKLKVLILTMHKGKELLEYAVAAGADGYLLKEYAPAELLDAIRVIEQGQVYISPLIVPYLLIQDVDGKSFIKEIVEIANNKWAHPGIGPFAEEFVGGMNPHGSSVPAKTAALQQLLGLFGNPQSTRPKSQSSSKETAATVAAAGMVRSQAVTIRRATPQRTADSRLEEPTPKIAADMTCVVLIGAPNDEAIAITPAADVSAENPCTASR